MGVEGHRVRTVEAREQRACRRRRRRGDTVCTVDVEPHAPLRAYLGDLVDRVDGAGQRRARRRDDRHGRHARAAIRVDCVRDGRGPQPAAAVDRKRSHPVGADPEQLGRADDRVVRLLRAVERGVRARHPLAARTRKSPLPRRRQRGHVRDRPAAGEGAGRRRVADELAHPAHRLVLDLRGRAGPHREIDVEARRQEVAEDADLETRRAHEREEARPGLGDRLVEQLRRVVERGEDARPLLGERRTQEGVEAAVEVRLARAGTVEAAPCPRHDRRRPLERLLARRVEAERRELRRGGHRRVVVPEVRPRLARPAITPSCRRGSGASSGRSRSRARSHRPRGRCPSCRRRRRAP